MSAPTYARGGGEAGEEQTCRLGALIGRDDWRLCAWITGLALAALISLFFGDHLFHLAYGVGQ